MEWCPKSSIRMFSKLWQYQIIDTYLQVTYLKTIILCSVSSIWFVKYVFFAKIWFLKTSTRIVKYESRVVKANPVSCSSAFGVTLRTYFSNQNPFSQYHKRVSWNACKILQTYLMEVIEKAVGYWIMYNWKRFLSYGKFENHQKCRTVSSKEFKIIK